MGAWHGRYSSEWNGMLSCRKIRAHALTPTHLPFLSVSSPCLVQANLLSCLTPLFSVLPCHCPCRSPALYLRRCIQCLFFFFAVLVSLMPIVPGMSFLPLPLFLLYISTYFLMTLDLWYCLHLHLATLPSIVSCLLTTTNYRVRLSPTHISMYCRFQAQCRRASVRVVCRYVHVCSIAWLRCVRLSFLAE